MARYTGPVCRLCRREGTKLFLKGDKCYSGKCAISKRQTPPGQHTRGRRKPSEYGLQLREKQKCKRYYGVLETQFEHYFELAAQKAGVTGENLLSLLESRLDNTVYRLGFAMSRAEARQLVRHGHFTINGNRVNIPSYLVRAGEVIAVKDKSRDSEKIKSILEANATRPTPKWLELDRQNLQAKVIAAPARDDIDMEFHEHLIVELYSK